jgi:hypothetical protein
LCISTGRLERRWVRVERGKVLKRIADDVAFDTELGGKVGGYGFDFDSYWFVFLLRLDAGNLIF